MFIFRKQIYILVILSGVFSRAAQVVDLDDTATPQCTSYSNNVSQAQLDAIQPMFIQRSHRLWHLFFHGLRSSWSNFTQPQKDLLKSIHPSLEVTRPFVLGDSSNGASEDFIYMHRTMIRMVRERLVAAKLPCIGSFESVPRPEDPIWPVPAIWFGASSLTAFTKSNLGYLTMTNLESKQFHNDTWLKEQSASSLAGQLEGTMHNYFHHRFSSNPNVPTRPLISVYSAPSSLYTQSSYAYLLDTYSSSVPKVFWKLHGYLEDVSLRWLSLKGYTSVSTNCNGRKGCYQWNNTWVGPSPDSICTCGHDHTGAEDSHEKDILDLITDYAAQYPSKAQDIERMLRIIDIRSAPGSD